MRGRFLLLALPLLVGLVPPAASAAVSVSVGISVPGVQIGINVPAYPELQPVPAYPVYYAPGLPANYFFYDGLYWVYVSDTWYSSSWYNGPWDVVEPAVVPVFVLRVPVRYYRVPPPYFSGWAVAEPPRWGTHWGPQWKSGTAAGTTGTLAMRLRRRRCRCISVNTWATGIRRANSST